MSVRRGQDVQGTKTIAAAGTIEILPAAGKGYQECGLSSKADATATGLSTTTQYYFSVNIDGAGATEYDITTAADATYAAVIILMNAAVSGATFSLVNGDLRCTSDTTGKTSSIALAAGTTGTDLFATLTGFSAFETAVRPNGQRYHITDVEIQISTFQDTGTLALSDGTSTWFGPWLCKDGNGNTISLKFHPDNPWMWEKNKPVNLVCATANVGARCTIKAFCP